MVVTAYSSSFICISPTAAVFLLRTDLLLPIFRGVEGKKFLPLNTKSPILDPVQDYFFYYVVHKEPDLSKNTTGQPMYK